MIQEKLARIVYVAIVLVLYIIATKSLGLDEHTAIILILIASLKPWDVL